MKLVIVESPSKGKTIQKYLGKDFIVTASKGHITELAKGGNHGIGVDINNSFKPHYILMKDKVGTLNEIMSLAKKCDQILIASDPDREGNAIAWHLQERLKDLDIPIKRLVFKEITKKSVNEALKNLGDVDIPLFRSQEARRVLDRIVGFKVSPFLMNFFGPNLSAGRVQSVVARMVIDREKEIDDFIPEDFWKIDVNLSNDGIVNFISKYDSKITDQKTADKIEKSLLGVDYVVSDVIADEEKKYAPPPLITSTLQQMMSKVFNIPADKTMKGAQGLYERGFCTYIRTDSVRAEDDAVKNVRDWLKDNNHAVSLKTNAFKNKDASQDAHECIRPTDLDMLPGTSNLTDPVEQKVYELIWKFFVASQMPPAIYSTLKVIAHPVSDKSLKVKASGKALKDLGYLKILDLNKNTSTKIEIPFLKKGDTLKLFGKTPVKTEKKQTQPPPRFSESDLIEELKKKNIGRPATYADILSKITHRDYVVKNGNVYRPTDLGKKITNVLTKFFPFMDYSYTADLEKQLDEIAEDKVKYIDMLSGFYSPFAKQLNDAYMSYGSQICNKCKSPMTIRNGKNGKFWGCTQYPNCNGIQNYVE